MATSGATRVHANCCSHVQLTADANHAIKKLMPHRPVSAASCISGRLPYCEYASEPHDAAGVIRARSSSKATQASGKTSVDAHPSMRGATSRSMTSEAIAASVIPAIAAKYIAPGTGITSR
jgi:hypothetical protein